ncbi:MAG TPA: hypothetical protein PKA64_10030 [Myxococcota bacterium]|nr:hypothetical protein [Myxococcota bacterium]
MSVASPVDETMSSRELVRTLRAGVTRCDDMLPESLAWHTYIELSRRGVTEATSLFLAALRTLHHRRTVAGSTLPTNDVHTDEHKLTGDPMLGELWKAYKKCIRNNRTGPASEILKEIEARLVTH